MNGKLRKALTESIREIETRGASIEDCLARYPEHADSLRLNLTLWQGLNASEKAQPAYAGQQRGQQRLLAELADSIRPRQGGIPSVLAPAVARVAAMLAALAVIGGGAVGASAALGGPNLAEQVLSTVGVTQEKETAEETLETVDENTLDEADLGLDTASDAIDGGVDGLEIARDRTPDEAGGGLDRAIGIREARGNGTGPDGLPDEAQGGQDRANDARSGGPPDDRGRDGDENKPADTPSGPDTAPRSPYAPGP